MDTVARVARARPHAAIPQMRVAKAAHVVRRIACGLVVAVLAAQVARAVAGDTVAVKRGPGQPVVTWVPDPGAAARARMTPQEVMVRAGTCLPQADDTVVIAGPESGHLLDDLASKPAGTFWRVEARNAPVRRRHVDSTLARVDLNAVFDDADGRLVCLYTEARSEWVLPCCGDSAGTIAWMAKTTGWSLAETPEVRLEGSFADILGALWAEVGIPPGSAGQIAVRPRRVDFPGRGRHPEEWKNEPLWFIEVRGAVAWERYGVYKSGLIGFMNPGNLDDWSVVYLD